MNFVLPSAWRFTASRGGLNRYSEMKKARNYSALTEVSLFGPAAGWSAFADQVSQMHT